jgi:type IV secretion system protein VirB4
MLRGTRERAIRREINAADRVPYTAHVAPTVVKTAYGDYVQAFRLGGASFESCDDEQLNNWHERLNVFWRNVASPHVAIWTHIIRGRDRLMPLHADGARLSWATTDFAAALENKYARRLSAETLMSNEIYLALIYRPAPTISTGFLANLIVKARADAASTETLEALDACEKLAQQVYASLARYEPEVLGVYEIAGVCHSSLLEYFGVLVNGEQKPALLPRGPLNEALVSSRLFFGHEAIEYRMPSATRVGAMLGIKEYPTPTSAGMYNRLLSMKFPLVLTQSFTFLTKAAGQALLQRQFNRMSNAGDFAISQAQELKQALDALTSNEFVIGDHHLSLQILVDIIEPGDTNHERGRLKSLNDHVAQARGILADTGMSVAREDLALEGAFWAQLPGNFPFRPRKAPMTSRNFAAMAPFHNFPRGRVRNNHWGDALTTFITSAASPYYFPCTRAIRPTPTAEAARTPGIP